MPILQTGFEEWMVLRYGNDSSSWRALHNRESLPYLVLCRFGQTVQLNPRVLTKPEFDGDGNSVTLDTSFTLQLSGGWTYPDSSGIDHGDLQPDGTYTAPTGWDWHGPVGAIPAVVKVFIRSSTFPMAQLPYIERAEFNNLRSCMLVCLRP